MSQVRNIGLFQEKDILGKLIDLQECRAISKIDRDDIAKKVIAQALGVSPQELDKESFLQKTILKLAKQYDESIVIPADFTFGDFGTSWTASDNFENEQNEPDPAIGIRYMGLDERTLAKIVEAFNQHYGCVIAKTHEEIYANCRRHANDYVDPIICFDMPKFFQSIIYDVAQAHMQQGLSAVLR